MRLGCRALWDLACVGRGDGLGGGATDAMFAVGTEVAAVIEGGFDRVAGGGVAGSAVPGTTGVQSCDAGGWSG
jgi:hypothetical protein